MQGFVVGCVTKRVNDSITVVGSVLIVAVSYLVLVSGATVWSMTILDSSHLFYTLLFLDDDLNTLSTLSGAHSNDNGRGSSQHTHQ